MHRPQKTTVPLQAGTLAPLSARQVDASMVLWMVFLTGLWGLNAISIKVLVGGMAPIMGAALRGLVALLLLTLYGWARGGWVSYLNRVGLHAMVNGVVFGLEFILIYAGARYTNGGHLSLFLNTAPFFVAIGAHYLLPGDRLTSQRVLGLGLAFVGVVALFANEVFVTDSGFWRGDLMVLVAAMLWGGATLYIKRVIADGMNAFGLLYAQMLASTPMLFLASWWLEPAPFHHTTALTWSMVAYQGVVVAFFSYLVWLALLRRYPASAMQSFTFMSPVWGVVMGVILLGETVTVLTVAGMALVGLGLYLVNRPRRPASATA